MLWQTPLYLVHRNSKVLHSQPLAADPLHPYLHPTSKLLYPQTFRPGPSNFQTRPPIPYLHPKSKLLHHLTFRLDPYLLFTPKVETIIPSNFQTRPFKLSDPTTYPIFTLKIKLLHHLTFTLDTIPPIYTECQFFILKVPDPASHLPRDYCWFQNMHLNFHELTRAYSHNARNSEKSSENTQ